MLRILLLFMVTSPLLLRGQCVDMDQHNTSLLDMWVSCEARESPLGGTAKSHWVMYEFDQVMPIEGIQLWNINHPLYRSYGASKIKVETSADGARWVSRDTLSLDRAPAHNQYVGEIYDDFEPYDAKFVLLTVIENHGGRCTGLSEVKFSLGEVTTSTEDTYLSNQVIASPNPADGYVDIDLSALEIQVLSYRLLDMMGREHASTRLSQSAIRRNINIDTSILPDGQYALHIETDQGVIAKPIVVVHPK